MKIEANGVSFNYTIEGRPGAPWLVFSNSLATNLALWDAQVEAFKQSFQILRYDQRGHGSSAVPEKSSTFDVLAADVVALLDILEIERAHFVGISLGGITALVLAALYPQRLTSIVVSNAQCIAPPAAGAEWQGRMLMAQEHGMAALVEPTIQRWFHPDFVAANPPVLDKVRQMIRTTPVQGFVGCARALQYFNFCSALDTIELPTLFIVGAQDGILPEKMREMRQQVRGSALIELDPAGHLSNIEQPEAFNQALQQFLSGR